MLYSRRQFAMYAGGLGVLDQPNHCLHLLLEVNGDSFLEESVKVCSHSIIKRFYYNLMKGKGLSSYPTMQIIKSNNMQKLLYCCMSTILI